jgi:hypothetical protein
MDHFSDMPDLTVSLNFFQWLYLLGPTVGAFFLVIFVMAPACWPRRTRKPSGDRGQRRFADNPRFDRGSFRPTLSFFPPYRFHASRRRSDQRQNVRGFLPERSE